jgi:Ca2+-binding EF-hand superfamily protein
MVKILMISVLALLPAIAQAQDATLVFGALDADDDGSVSQDEASINDFVSEGFEAADSNGDGALSREEFAAAFGEN